MSLSSGNSNSSALDGTGSNTSVRYSTLMDAQELSVTESGFEINKSLSEPMTAKGIAKLLKKKLTPSNRLVLGPPFANFDRVLDHLYLTSIGGLTTDNIHRYNITLSINATHELPNLNHKNVKTYRVPVDDMITEDIFIFFGDVADMIEENALSHSSGKRGATVVHCMAGASRSSTLVIAYLIKYANMTVKDAFLYVRKIRPCARPNIAFMGQLMAYERMLRGSCTSSILHFVYSERLIRMPNFYEEECFSLWQTEVAKQSGVKLSTVKEQFPKKREPSAK